MDTTTTDRAKQDWVIREATPCLLDAAALRYGAASLRDVAQSLRNLPPITDEETLAGALQALRAALASMGAARRRAEAELDRKESY